MAEFGKTVDVLVEKFRIQEGFFDAFRIIYKIIMLINELIAIGKTLPGSTMGGVVAKAEAASRVFVNIEDELKKIHSGI
jgi:hypothetical protein